MTSSAIAPNVSPRLRHWHDSAVVRSLILATTFVSVAAWQALELSAVTNKDIWLHLRTGIWMLENRGIPHAGILSQSASLPWVDASWGFDLLTALFYRAGGLSGLPLLLVFLEVAVAGALFALALSTSGSFWAAVVLSAIAQCCLVPLQPGPALFSILLLALELALLINARRSGDARRLYWLPLLFVAWANLDWQFAFGLLGLALFGVATVIEHLGLRIGVGNRAAAEIPLARVAAVVAASFLATFVSPYVWLLHATAWQNVAAAAADCYFREMHSLRFRGPQDYLLMLLTMTAFFALGRRRSRDLFLTSLLAFPAVLSFRITSDSWLVVVCAVAIIANALRDQGGIAGVGVQSLLRRGEKLATASLVVLVIIITYGAKAPLLSKMGETFPVRAADYIRKNHLPQPIFNTYDWGGFLTWYLPEYPVAIDSRRDLYGDDLTIAYFKLMQGEVPVESDSSFERARTILLEVNSPLAQALSRLPDFRVVYQDNVAVVLVRTN